MNINSLFSSFSSKMPSYQSLSKVGFGVMGALSPVLAGMAVRAAGKGSYLQSGVCALAALTGPSFFRNIETVGRKIWGSIFYVQDLSSQVNDLSKRISDVGARAQALMPKNPNSQPLDAGAVVKRVDRVVALSESVIEKAEWIAKNPAEAALLAFCTLAACSFRLVACLAVLYGISEVSKKIFRSEKTNQNCEFA